MQTVILNRTSRLLSGHLWVFSNELAGSPKRLVPGGLVELVDKKNNFMGIGYANPHSLIAVRVLTWINEPINEAFFEKRIRAALDYRKRFLAGRDSFRVVYSESDLLPGLIVDKYGTCLSVQFQTLGMEKWQEIIIKALDDIFAPETIVLRNDSSIRTLEGLQMEKRVVKGALDVLPVMRDEGMILEVDPISGQKTGFFHDQAENRRALAALTADGAALDLFCYTGAWSLKLAAKGAKTIGVDSSVYAVTQAERNAEMNGLSNKCSFVKSDVFEFIKTAIANKSAYDYVVLDPPAFVKSKAKIPEAVRAYREINASVMKLVKYGGILATSSCSHHISREMFMDILRASARDAVRHARFIEIRTQASDHPISLHVPETEYLKCMILQMV